jgi:hypothetical protein
MEVRLRLLVAIVLMPLAGLLFSPLPVAAVSLPGDTMVATSTVQLSGGRGTQVWWYSGDETTGVVTNYSASGQVESIEKIVFRVHDHFLDHTDTALFPQQSSWAVDVVMSHCGTTDCDPGDWLYPSPSDTAHLISIHQLHLVGRSTTINGVQARELVSTAGVAAISQGVGWINPVNDEIIESDVPPNAPAQSFKWERASKATRAHLAVAIPRGFVEVSALCAAPEGQLIPPGLGGRDPCS